MSSYMYSKKKKVYERIPDLTYNSLIDSDSYKVSHWWMLPPGMTQSFHYMESRGGRFQNIVFFGLQYIVNKYLAAPITMEMFEEWDAMMKWHGPRPNTAQMREIAELGYWPVRVKAVKEGSVVPVSNAIITMESTDERYAWVPGYLEAMVHRVWGPITVATVSYHCRKICEHFVDTTVGDRAAVKFMLQDFGARGVSSYEGAELLGAAHLVNFAGTDTMPATRLARHYYFEPQSGYSVNAAEHFVVTAWGGPDKELQAFEHIIKNAPVGSILSLISDSYDYFDAIQNKLPKFKKVLEERDIKLVPRPDSGDPVEIVTKSLSILEEKFGSTLNSKSFKEFGMGVKIIYGDSITEDMMRRILQVAMEQGYAASNFVFGMGGALLQGVTRDTQKFAMKCSEVVVNGERRDVYKDPVTDPGKRSKRGKLDLEIKDGKYNTVKYPAEFGSALELVYEDGKIYRQQELKDIRALAHGNNF